MHLLNQKMRPVGRPEPSQLDLAPPMRPQCASYLPFKFVAEWIMSVVMLPPAALVIGTLGVLVKLTSSGPMFYHQKRVGLNGRVFTMIKLRTMVQDSEIKSGPVWSQPGDPRVTPIGRLLRDTHLDELPQIWNVIRGEMSLIGPRPERPEIVARLEQTIPNYRDRLSVRPGLTGLAQVQLPPDADEETVKRKLSYDRYYVLRVSPWLDMRVLLSTFLYFSSSALGALCHGLVRSYGRDIEENFDRSKMLDESQTQTA